MLEKVLWGLLAVVNFFIAYSVATGAPINRLSTTLVWLALGIVYASIAFGWVHFDRRKVICLNANTAILQSLRPRSS